MGVLDVMYPRCCVGCGGPGWPFCQDCDALIPRFGEHGCLRCGAPATVGRAHCRSCPPPQIDWARSPYLFDGPIRGAIHRLKFGGDRGVARALGHAMASVVRDSGVGIDAITWVPLARTRRAKRGYDQARALAVAVADELGAPRQALVRRTRRSGPQAQRTAADRRLAMQGMFTPARSAPQRILLIDDVLTTGATAGACATALREGGASTIGVLTAARAVR